MLFENLYSGKNIKSCAKAKKHQKSIFSIFALFDFSKRFRKFVVIVPTKLMDEGS